MVYFVTNRESHIPVTINHVSSVVIDTPNRSPVIFLISDQINFVVSNIHPVISVVHG